MLSENYQKDFILAGSLAKQVRAYGKSLIVKNASYRDVIHKIKHKIKELGAQPAFPPQIAINHVAAHFLPQPDEDIIFHDQVIKLDVGICYNGAIGDCAVTIDLSGKYQLLVEAVEAALAAAEKTVEVGVPFREIGRVIEQTITSYGFNPVRNLSGHGLGYYQIHTPPSVPNYFDRSTAVIKPGMTFAIEPFATDGEGLIRESGEATIFSFIKKRPTQSSVAKLLVEKIRRYNGLPFALDDFIEEKLTSAEVKSGFKELLKDKIINGYPPLVEEIHTKVAQAENSVLVDRNGQVFITTR